MTISEARDTPTREAKEVPPFRKPTPKERYAMGEEYARLEEKAS